MGKQRKIPAIALTVACLFSASAANVDTSTKHSKGRPNHEHHGNRRRSKNFTNPNQRPSTLDNE